MATATIEGVHTISYIPQKGYQFLSVNLALVDLVAISEIAQELEFKPELVQIPSRTGVQVHALLWEGKTSDAPADLEDRIDALADRINPDAIRAPRSTWTDAA